MMHGPHGILNPANSRMQKLSCKNWYPRSFSEETIEGDDSYPIYRNRDDERKAKVRNQMLDSRWVFPYNHYLLLRFNCHVNVEICSNFKICKYLCKYINKGKKNHVAFGIWSEKDYMETSEIDQFQNGRWISPPEAMWIIYQLHLSEMYPHVQSLQLHLLAVNI